MDIRTYFIAKLRLFPISIFLSGLYEARPVPSCRARRELHARIKNFQERKDSHLTRTGSCSKAKFDENSKGGTHCGK